MRVLACMLLVAGPAHCGPPQDLPTVTVKRGTRILRFAPGLETTIEGLIRAVLGSCSAEVGDDAENRKRYDEVLKGDHVRILYANPRAMAANVEKEVVVATEIVFGKGRLIVRNGDHYRCLSKYQHDYVAPLQKLVETLPAK